MCETSTLTAGQPYYLAVTENSNIPDLYDLLMEPRPRVVGADTTGQFYEIDPYTGAATALGNSAVYDLEPLVTLETKRALLSRACADGWMLVFEHDPAVALGSVVRDGDRFAFAALDTPKVGD